MFSGLTVTRADGSDGGACMFLAPSSNLDCITPELNLHPQSSMVVTHCILIAAPFTRPRKDDRLSRSFRESRHRLTIDALHYITMMKISGVLIGQPHH